MKELTHEQAHEAEVWLTRNYGYVTNRSIAMQAYWAREDRTDERLEQDNKKLRAVIEARNRHVEHLKDSNDDIKLILASKIANNLRGIITADFDKQSAERDATIDGLKRNEEHLLAASKNMEHKISRLSKELEAALLHKNTILEQLRRITAI
jgi:hypothetical protein